MTNEITFIGGGNMATAMIGGLLRAGSDGSRIHVAETNPERRQALQEMGVRSYASVAEVAATSCVVLAVKPQGMAQTCAELKPLLAADSLIISIAAGIRSDSILAWLGKPLAIVRAMPNTPALYGMGASGLVANSNCSAAHKAQAQAILSATGIVQWFDSESDLDVVTALSGSGPAYYFRVMEVMIEAAVAQGLSADAAKQLTIQTALGAAHMAQNSDLDLASLRKNVTSPGGTTERGLEVLQSHAIDAIFKQVIEAATARSIELSQKLGDAN